MKNVIMKNGMWALGLLLVLGVSVAAYGVSGTGDQTDSAGKASCPVSAEACGAEEAGSKTCCADKASAKTCCADKAAAKECCQDKGSKGECSGAKCCEDKGEAGAEGECCESGKDAGSCCSKK